MKKIVLDIDVSPWITKDGDINVAIYVGNECEPVFDDNFSFNEMLDQAIESYLLPGSNKIANYHRKDVKQMRKALKKAVKDFDKRVEEIGYD